MKCCKLQTKKLKWIFLKAASDLIKFTDSKTSFHNKSPQRELYRENNELLNSAVTTVEETETQRQPGDDRTDASELNLRKTKLVKT